MRDTFTCPRCGDNFSTQFALENHRFACRDEVQSIRHAWMREAIKSRERNGVPDWTDGLLKPWKEDAA